MAATTNVSFDALSATAFATEAINDINLNYGGAAATVSGATIDNTTVSSTGSASGSYTVNSNTITSTGVGNSASEEIDLSLIENDVEEGAAAASLSYNTGAITSAVNSSTVAVDIDGFASGTVSNSGNTIAAQTQANTGTTLLAGEIPNDYASAAAGSASVDFVQSGAQGGTANGSLAVASAQVNQGPGNSAAVEDNDVTLALTSAGTNTVTAGPDLDDNTVSATLRGNNAQNTIRLNDGDNPEFEGSAVVNNMQLNTAGGTATNSGTTVAAEVAANSAAFVNELNGGLSVAGNTISSSAAGNSALANSGSPVGNEIVIGDTLSITGTQATGGSTLVLDAGDLDADSAATLAVLSAQGNLGSDHDAETTGGTITATVQSLEDGKVALSANTISAGASGNVSTSAIRSTGTGTTFEASAALANSQTNLGSDTSATNTGGVISSESGIDGGVTTGSQIAVNDNSMSATAFGNETGQTLSLNATNLNLDSGVASLDGGSAPDGNASASGAATIANLQANYSSDVSAQLSGSVIGLDADARGGIGASTLVGNSLQVTGNAQDVLAAGSSGNNTLSLTGNTVGGSAGLANIQVGEGSDVTSTLSGSVAGIVASTHVDGGTIELSENTQRARAFGSSASNRVSVAGTSADGLESSVASVGSDAAAGEVVSNYGLLNNQSSIGDVQSTADASGAPFGEGGFVIAVEGDLDNASTSNDLNSLSGLAFGNQASNTTSIDIGTITTDNTNGNSQVANALNLQLSTGAVSATATGDAVMNTYIEDSISGANVSTSENVIQAQATGNLATNVTTVDATNLETTRLAAVDFAGGFQTDAAFSVSNAQETYGTVSASQLDSVTSPTQSANILTTIDGVSGVGIAGSTVRSDSNTSETRATANSATNGVMISANGVDASSAVTNDQFTSSTLDVTMGIAGSAPVADEDYTLGGTGSTSDELTVGASLVTIAGGQSLVITFDDAAPGGAELAALLDGMTGVTVTGGTATFGPGTYDFTGFDGFSASTTSGVGTTVAFNGFSVDGSPGVAPAGGVTIAANGPSVSNSTLSVADNISRGAATGNSATNMLSVEATAIAGDIATAPASGEATHVLANQQENVATSQTSSVMAAFAVETAEDAAISGSTITVSDNTQSATTVGNTAQNVLSLAGVDGAAAASVEASSELLSSQETVGIVSATSTMQASAAAAVTGSTLTIDGNRNTALAVANDATSTATVSAANVTTAATAPTSAALVSGDLVTTAADHLVASQQSSFGLTSATAESNLFNQDLLDTATTGIANSTVSMSGNATIAEASNNRATNSLTLNSGALLTANGGVMNDQFSTGGATASATADVTLALAGDTGVAALSGSSLSLDGNSTTALARGNFASNALNASAGAGYGAADAGSVTVTGSSAATVNATYGVLNAQGNVGAINATNAGTTYQVTLSGASASDLGISAGSISASGNLIAADAYGNQASNTLVLAGLNTTMPTAGIGSSQFNSGSVTSMVTGATIGMSGTGTVGTSGLSVGGNSISASAIGNSVTNKISGN